MRRCTRFFSQHTARSNAELIERLLIGDITVHEVLRAISYTLVISNLPLQLPLPSIERNAL